MATRIYVDVKLTNDGDIEAAARGFIKPEDIRSVVVRGRIDTGCTHLAIPEDIAQQLGLRMLEQVRVRYANNASAEKWRGSVVVVEINNRRARFSPVIEIAGTEVLIGNPVIEDMDFLINPETGELYPNPKSPDMPLAELLRCDHGN